LSAWSQALEAAIAIGAMEWFSRASHYPLVIIPFATSIVRVVGSPDAEPAQPRALIGGHVVSTIMGLALLKFTGPHAWAAAAGVGLAVIAMYLTGTFHPPAGINPLLVISNNLSWLFLFAPVLAAALRPSTTGRPSAVISAHRRELDRGRGPVSAFITPWTKMMERRSASRESEIASRFI